MFNTFRAVKAIVKKDLSLETLRSIYKTPVLARQVPKVLLLPMVQDSIQIGADNFERSYKVLNFMTKETYDSLLELYVMEALEKNYNVRGNAEMVKALFA